MLTVTFQRLAAKLGIFRNLSHLWPYERGSVSNDYDYLQNTRALMFKAVQPGLLISCLIFADFDFLCYPGVSLLMSIFTG